jgi:hypothetical protein
MLDSVYLDLRDRHARQRRKQHPAQTVAQRCAVAALQRLDYEPAVGTVRRQLIDFYSGLFYLNQLITLLTDGHMKTMP